MPRPTTLQALMARPEVESVQLQKRPPCVGVAIGGKWTWHYGPAIPDALAAALATLEKP